MENRYNHLECDDKIRQLWLVNQTYRNHNHAYKLYTIDTPPPTVSGSLHIGHIFSYTQTDIIARYKRMTGHNVFYPFGFDCNGLATERFVEKKHNTNASKIGREKFVELCLSTTEEMKIKFVQLWRTLGLSAELENTYSTISSDVQRIAQQSFIELVRKNYAYIKKEPALYCTQCRTTVAQAELDDMEQATTFNDIEFKSETGASLMVATTRPELLSSCVALLYHPSDVRYQHLKNKQAIVPLFSNSVAILADESVLPEKGTGLVMVCTFGDKTDIEWFKKYDLPYKQSIGFDGKFIASVAELAGLNVLDARKKIIMLLQENGLLHGQKAITNSVNVHERCKQPIEYVILSQWFIKVVENSAAFLDAADKIDWFPGHMKSRYVDWVSHLSWDWCISRQRVFGIPFPVWYCNDCGTTLLADVSELPVDPQKTTYNGRCNNCNGLNIRAEKDVMDTWNTSSLTPYICKELYEKQRGYLFADSDFLPMSMRPQAHDIIRTWAFYTIVKAWMHQKEIPWNDIIISGYVLSENKEKISKSKDNAPTDPEKLLTMYAPDAIRFWTASGTLGQDIAFSNEQIIIGQKLLTKLWNGLKFVHLHIAGQEIGDISQKPKNLGVINEWMFDQMQTALKQYHHCFEKNEFSFALQSVEKVFWNDFCDNYLEIVKDQMFNPANYNQQEVAATKWTLQYTGFLLLQMYAPYLPHITEYLYQHIFLGSVKTSSLHLTQLVTARQVNDKNNKKMAVILNVIGLVRKLKTAAQLSLKVELETLTICNVDTETIAIINNELSILKGVCKVKNIIFSEIKNDAALLQNGDVYSAIINL